MPLVAKSAGSAKPFASSRAKAFEGISMGELNKRDEVDGIFTLQQALDEIEEARAESPFGKKNLRPGAESRATNHPESSSRRHSKRLSIPRSSSYNTDPAITSSASASKTKPSDSVTNDHKPNYAIPKRTDYANSYYVRSVGEQEVAIRLPSCSSLPSTWTSTHDRLIAYMATHAPLTKEGKIPAREESRERWATRQMIELLKDRFPKLRGTKLRASGIEDRLIWLDEAYGRNDYFGMPYGAYQMEEWGWGI